MTIIRWAAIVWCAMCMAVPASALDHRAGINIGSAFLYGDNATSDPGASLGLSYEISVAPYLSLGVRTTYRHTAGISKITDPASIFYGPHEYDTTFLSGDFVARLSLPKRRVRPYVTLGIGESLWVPGKNDNIASLPMEQKISWSASPQISLGAGLSVLFGRHWSLDFGAESSFFFTDGLDNVDGGYVSGGSDSNDFLVTAGFALIYHFGEGHTPAPRRLIPPSPETEPPSPAREEPEPATQPATPLRREEPVQIPSQTPAEPDTTRTLPDSIERTSPEVAQPDTTSSVPAETVLPPAPARESTETPAPVQTPSRRASTRSYLVHVASFPTAGEADTQAAALRSAGYRTRIDSVDRGDIGIWFRVHVGPYPTRTEAEQTAERLIQAGLSDYAAVIEEEP